MSVVNPFRLGFPALPAPLRSYDRDNEAQYRLAIEQLLKQVVSATNVTANTRNVIESVLQFRPNNTVDVGDITGPYLPRTVYAATSMITPVLTASVSATAPLLVGSLRVTSPTFGTTSATDVVFDRNSVTQLTLASSLATFVGDIAVGTGTVATTGRVRLANNSTGIQFRNAANNANIPALVVDNSNNTIIDSGTGGGIILRNIGFPFVTFSGSTATFATSIGAVFATTGGYVQFGNTLAAGLGRIRTRNNDLIIGSMTAAGGNASILQFSSGDETLLFGTQGIRMGVAPAGAKYWLIDADNNLSSVSPNYVFTVGGSTLTRANISATATFPTAGVGVGARLYGQRITVSASSPGLGAISTYALTLSASSAGSPTEAIALDILSGDSRFQTITQGTWNGTTIGTTYGGTGLTSYAPGDILYASAIDTLAKLAGNTTTTKKYLTMTGTGAGVNPPSWDALSVAPSDLTGYGAAGGYLRSNGSAWVRVSGLDVADLTGTTLPVSIVTSSLTTIGTLVSGAVPASLVTAGTFGAGAYGITGTGTTPLVLTRTGSGNNVSIQAVNSDGSLYFGMDSNEAFAVAGAADLAAAPWFRVNSAGAIIAGTYNAQTISSTANFTGSVTVATTVVLTAGNLTLSAGGIFQTNTGQSARYRNSSGTVDARQWDTRISAAGGLEFRSTTDAGTTVINALQLAHATGNAVFAGAITAGTYNGQTIANPANFTGALTIGGTLTVNSGNISISAGSLTASGNITATTALIGTTRVTAPLVGTVTGVDLVLDRNSVAMLTLGATTATFSKGNLTLTPASGVASIHTDTVDGADNAVLKLAGGGVESSSRGAVIQLFGNEGTSPGQLYLAPGSTGSVNIPGAVIGVTTLAVSGAITSTLATGTAPFAITSTTVVTNLNADLLDGQHGAYYNDAANLTGTVTETHGGTNQSTYTLGDTLYASATNTLSKLAGNTTTTKKVLRQVGDGSASAAPAWEAPKHYSIPIGSGQGSVTLTDADTMYFSIPAGVSPSSLASDQRRIYVPTACTMRTVDLFGYNSGPGGTNEAWSMYIRVNDTTDYLIATVSTAPGTPGTRRWTNTAINIALNADDYFCLKVVNPTWATNPGGFTLIGWVYLDA